MMLEPPDSLAASYRLVPLIDMDIVIVPSEWSKESSCGWIKKKEKNNVQKDITAFKNSSSVYRF